MTKQDKFDLLLGLVAAFDEAGEVTRGTMMGFPCLRRAGKFFVCLDRDGTSLIVKLPAERVSELVSQGAGLSFAPAGRVFREWIEVPKDRAEAWPGYIREALAFAS